MALKADSQNPLDYLNQMLKDNGLEIILPDDKESEEKNEEEKEETEEEK